MRKVRPAGRRRPGCVRRSPSTVKKSNQYPSSLLIGGFRDRLAERTPGVSRRRRSNSPYQTARSGARSPAAACALTGDSTSTFTTSRPSRSKPASFVSNPVRLRTKSAEPTSSTIDSATCAATSARAMPAGRRSAPAWRVPALSTGPGSMRTALTIGARLNAIAATPMAPAVNASTRPSTPSAMVTGS